MIILGGSYYNGPKSIFTGTAIIKDVNKIVLQNGIYDRLYVSNDISKQEIVDTYTSEAAKSVKIESGINRIETIDVYGKTTQEGTGDASPNNVREIENAGSKLVEKILTGTEAWVLRGMSQGISSEYIRYSIGESGDREAYGVCYCDRYKYFKSVSAYTAQNGVGLYGSESAPFDVILKKAEYPTVDVWKQKLKDLYAAGDPIKYYYTPKSGIPTTGIYMGIEVEQGENYHCEIVELQALLHEGDTLETNVSHEGAQKCVETHAKATYVFTGKESFSREDGWVDGAVRIGNAIPDAVKVNDYGTVANLKCSHLKTVSASEVVSLGLVGCSQGGGLNLYFYFGSTYNTTDLAKAYIAEQYAAGTPITIEYELAQPKVFADEAVIVENKAGEYTVSFESTGRVKLKPVINQEGWSDDTIIDAGFNGDLAGGNVDFTAESIDKIRIKRRKKGTANWVDLKDIIINVPDDFTFTFYDLFAANAAEYTYAVVPVIGDIEGNLSTVDIQSMFNGFFIADKNTIYGTEYNVNVGAATKNEKSSIVQTLGAKYPFIIDNGYNNYYTVPISLFFYNPNLDWQQNVQYRQTIVEWLHNGTAKIFKSEDGRIWLAKVTTAPVLTPGSNLNITSIDFSITEIGESNSTEDLYNSGLLSLIKES